MGRQIGLIRVLPERYGRTGDGDYSDLREPGAPAAHPSQYMLPSKSLPPRESTSGHSHRPPREARHGILKKKLESAPLRDTIAPTRDAPCQPKVTEVIRRLSPPASRSL